MHVDTQRYDKPFVLKFVVLTIRHTHTHFFLSMSNSNDFLISSGAQPHRGMKEYKHVLCIWIFYGELHYGMCLLGLQVCSRTD